jgi:hypothetical protein
MHPAIYLAVIEARETDLRAARYQERPVRKPRARVRLRVAISSRRLRAA